MQKVGLQELGPRFTLKLRTLQKGVFNPKFGEYEYVHKVRKIKQITQFSLQINFINQFFQTFSDTKWNLTEESSQFKLCFVKFMRILNKIIAQEIHNILYLGVGT